LNEDCQNKNIIMKSDATTVEQYMESLPEDRKLAMGKLRNIIKKNLPKGFKEVMAYGMIGYVVPHTIYPAGYHCDVKMPLPFMNLASQKNFIAVYSMAIYSNPAISKWFTSEYAKRVNSKLVMGKSCLRFTKTENIPFDLIGELCTKVTVAEWIATYEKVLKR
jgi:hypothetical protein